MPVGNIGAVERAVAGTQDLAVGQHHFHAAGETTLIEIGAVAGTLVERIAEHAAEALLVLTTNKYLILLLLNLLLLAVGCFLEPIAVISILMPILLPILLKVGIDPLHFGVVMTLNLMIGLLHPPLGMVLFVLMRVADLSLERATMAILPWLIPLLGSLILITMIPEITLWLPHLAGLAK